MGIELIPLIT